MIQEVQTFDREFVNKINSDIKVVYDKIKRDKKSLDERLTGICKTFNEEIIKLHDDMEKLNRCWLDFQFEDDKRIKSLQKSIEDLQNQIDNQVIKTDLIFSNTIHIIIKSYCSRYFEELYERIGSLENKKQ
jgi:predicted  nucleic acid-binding Zn-ribbon protein